MSFSEKEHFTVDELNEILYPKLVLQNEKEVMDMMEGGGTLTEELFKEYLESLKLEDADDRAVIELANYLHEDFKRFCYTFSLLPNISDNKSVLEIGANPYFLTALMKKYTRYSVECTNCFSDNLGAKYQESEQAMVKKDNPAERIPMKYFSLNIEENYYKEQKYDVVCCCEVIEHMTKSPVRVLLNINTMLKNNGFLILTTPNVCRLENVARMVAGANLYDPYSGYGIYGRHNREYNRHELFTLLKLCGFEMELVFTANVHTEYAYNYFKDMDSIINLINAVPNRIYDLGQYIFIRAKKIENLSSVDIPAWLYRCIPDTKITRGVPLC